MREPIVSVNILVPQEHLGNVIGLCIERRGVQKSLQFSAGQVSVHYEMPMSEVVMDFFDRLKSVTRGFGSLDYNFIRFEAADLVRLDILINGDRVDALAMIVHRAHAQQRGRQLTEKMKELIPRQMYDVAVQAAIGGQIIARQTVKALRKNVTAKCYGGDVTRKKKLLEKQKAGKKRMKQLGRSKSPRKRFSPPCGWIVSGHRLSVDFDVGGADHRRRVALRHLVVAAAPPPGCRSVSSRVTLGAVRTTKV